MTTDACTQVQLLDGFSLQLVRSGRCLVVADLPHGVQRLVANLGLAGRPTRAAVSGQLWPDVPEEQAQACLRSTLWRLQRAAPGVVEARGDCLSLGEEVHVDVRALACWVDRVLDPGVPLEGLTGSRAVLRGELLPGWYDDWVLLERERIRQLQMHALERLAERLAQDGRYAEALQAAWAAVRAEPLRESAHRLMVGIHLAEGNLGEAVRTYEAFRLLLAQELGAVPTPLMEQLLVAVPRRRSPARGRRTAHGLGSVPALDSGRYAEDDLRSPDRRAARGARA